MEGELVSTHDSDPNSQAPVDVPGGLRNPPVDNTDCDSLSFPMRWWVPEGPYQVVVKIGCAGRSTKPLLTTFEKGMLRSGPCKVHVCT